MKTDSWRRAGKMEAAALLIVDVQQGLFGRKKPVYNEQLLLANLSLLIDRAHRHKVSVCFTQQANKGLLAKGSENWRLHPALSPGKGDIFMDKHQAGAFGGTDLQARLEERGISRVMIMGLATHQCIKATCLEAQQLGFEVILVKDGHSSGREDAAGLIDVWNTRLERKGIKVIRAMEIEFTGR